MTKEQLLKQIVFLRRVPMFADLSDRELATCIDSLRLRRYAKSEIIFHQGDTSRDLYVVYEGKVRIFKTDPSGRETSISLFGPHDVVGEFAVIDGEPRSAAARTIGPCALLCMAGDTFLQHMQVMPRLAMGMARLLVSKVRWTAAYAEAMAQLDAAGRLLYLLLSYNERFGEESEAGKRYRLDLALTQADLASLVGVRREWVNRCLGQWSRRGLIQYEAGTITILDLVKLEQERDSRCGATSGDMEW